MRKDKFKCSNCERTYIRWESPCRDCGAVDSVVEIYSGPSKTTIRRRWKRSEREMARSMQDADGADPLYRNIASSTGKTGHITGLRFDAVSRTYISEDKNRDLPKWLILAWILLQQRSIDLKKNSLLHLNPPNLPSTIKLHNESFKTPSMAVITYDHHLELVKQARVLRELEEIINSDPKRYEELLDKIYFLKSK